MVGLSARGWSDLPERLRTTIQYAEVLLGSPRHLDLIPPFPCSAAAAVASSVARGAADAAQPGFRATRRGACLG